MSTTYPTLTETNFPDEVDSFTRMSDVTYADTPLINQFQEYILAGNTSAANQILIDNPTLKNKIMNASNMNKILDALSAIQQFFKNNVQTYIDDKSDVIQEQIDNFTDKGDYSGATIYIANNIVSYNGEGYICKQESTGNLPTNTSYFTKIASRGIQGASGTGLTWRGNYSAATSYYTDDCVTDGSKIWVAKQNSTGQSLVEGAYWTVAISIETSITSAVNTHNTASDAHATLFSGKADVGHVHDQYLNKSGGTMTGVLVAQANTSYTTYQVRNIALSTTAATPTGNGSLLGVYS